MSKLAILLLSLILLIPATLGLRELREGIGMMLLGDVGRGGSPINDWLEQHPKIKIFDIRQSSNGGSLAATKFYISVWYE